MLKLLQSLFRKKQNKKYEQEENKIWNSYYYLSGHNDKKVLVDMLGQRIEKIYIEDDQTIIITLSNGKHETQVSISGGIDCGGNALLCISKE